MGIPLTDIGHEREQGDVAGALDGHRELPLVGGAGARDPPRQDPPTLRHEAPETSDILVVNLLHLVHAELADLLPTIALPSLDHRHWSLPMFGPIVDSRTVPTLCFNLLQLPCRTRPQPSQQAGWSHAAHQVGTALERRLVLCRGRRRLFLPASAPPEELDAVCHHFVLRPLLPFGRLPRALGQAPLDQGRSPFFQILFARLGLLPPGDDGDVAHLIPTLSRLRGIAPIDGQIKAADRCPAWRVPELRVSGQISDKDDPVEVRHALRSLPFRSTGCGSRGCLRACGPLDPDRQIPENDLGEFEVPVHGLREGGLALDPEEDVGALPLFLDLERQAASPPLLDLEQLGPFPFEESPKRLHLGPDRLLPRGFGRLTTGPGLLPDVKPIHGRCHTPLDNLLDGVGCAADEVGEEASLGLIKGVQDECPLLPPPGPTNAYAHRGEPHRLDGLLDETAPAVPAVSSLGHDLDPPKGEIEIVVNHHEPLWRDRLSFQPRLDRPAALIHEGEGLDEGDRFISPRLLRVQTLPTATGHRSVPPPRQLVQDHEAHVVTASSVFGSRVSQADDEPQCLPSLLLGSSLG